MLDNIFLANIPLDESKIKYFDPKNKQLYQFSGNLAGYIYYAFINDSELDEINVSAYLKKSKFVIFVNSQDYQISEDEINITIKP